MKKLYTLIRPIEPEAFKLHIGYNIPVIDFRNLVEIFNPTINDFKKLAIGPYFWFIVDFINWKHILGGGDIEKMSPLKICDLSDASPQKLYDITHPDDLPKVLAFSNFWINYYSTLTPERKPQVTVTLYFRLLNAEQNYYWIMVQYPFSIIDENDKILYGLVLVTDISHLKKEGRPMMTIMDTYDGRYQQFICSENNTLSGKDIMQPLTVREIEVLGYIAKGYCSKQIASYLNLAVKTIDNHRQNMLHKTITKSSAELVNHCIGMGYI
ncbi:MAG: LuxR C-terminal-related transcriptional regulator [Ginsengibacter sp.]